jgi:hypothetical protein
MSAPDASGPTRLATSLRAPLLLACTLALFFLPALIGSEQFMYRDVGRFHYPTKHYIAEELSQGHFPQWNPYNGLGVPILAGAIDAVEHPFTLLLAALPFELAFKLWGLLSYLLAALGAYAWARQLGRSETGAILAGLAFALSGYMVSTSDNLTYLTTYAAIPLLFAAAHAYLALGGVGRLALTGLASYVCASGGDPVGWGLAALALPLYGATVVAGPGARSRTAGRGVAALGAALIAAAPIIVPVVFWVQASSRGGPFGAHDAGYWDLAPLRLLELLVPHVLRADPAVTSSRVFMVFAGDGVNLIPWAMSVYAGAGAVTLGVVGAVRARPARWLLVAAAALTWVALGDHAGAGQLIRALPLASSIRYMEKLAVWPALLVSVAAAFGLDALREAGVARRTGRAVVLVGVAVLFLGLAALLGREGLASWLVRGLPLGPHRALAQDAVTGASRDLAVNLSDGLLHSGAFLLLTGGAVILVAGGRHLRVTLALVAAVVVGDLFLANSRAYTLQRPERPPCSALLTYLTEQPGLTRIATPFLPVVPDDQPHFPAVTRYGSLTAYPEFNTQVRVGNFEPYAGLIPARHQYFLWRSGTVAAAAPRLGLWGVEYLVVPATTDLAREARLAPPYDVVVHDRALFTSLVRLAHRPRVYLARELTSVDRRSAMEFALKANPSRTTASVVEGPVPGNYRPPAGEVVIAEDRPERVRLRVRADAPALAILDDVFADGWSATVDGRLAEILPANYLVRAVWVGPGEHEIDFRYQTPGLGLGWLIFGAGAACAGAALLLQRSRRRVLPGHAVGPEPPGAACRWRGR